MDAVFLSRMVRELVREHDSLSLPGLGTFEVEDVPAAFSDRGYTVNPPYRSLSFSGKKTDDGLLAGLYARDNEAVSISDADGIIRNFVAGLADTLRADKYVELPGLGRLRATKENVPFFVPDDGLDISPESCGLPQVSLRTRRSADLPPLPFVSDGASPERASSSALPADAPIAAAQVVAAPDAAGPIAAVPVVAAPIAAAADAAVPIAAEPVTAVPVVPDVAAPIAAVKVEAVPDVAAPVSTEPVAAAQVVAAPEAAESIAAVSVAAEPVEAAPNVAVPAPVAPDAVAADPQEHASASSVHAAAVDGLSVGADSASESVLEDAASGPAASSRDEAPEDSTEKVSSASGGGVHPLLRTVLLLIVAALVILAVFAAVSRIFPGSTDFLLYSPEELEILNYPENGIGLPG